jgi:branched-chain amino acid aminotransferase
VARGDTLPAHLPHLASLSQLQTPPWAISEGELVAYSDVCIHISAEALTRALSVFEGIKGYWDEGSTSFAIRALDRHYTRLCESARLFEIPMPVSYEEFRGQCDQLAGELVRPDKDLWMRTTLYVVEGHWGEGTRANLVITGFHQPKLPPTPVSLAVSTWRRAADDQMPPRVKSSANYVVARLARIEAHGRGCDDAILLNQHGRVAEATGACVIAARNGTLVTPPTWEGALDSITVSVLRELAARRGIPVEQRPLDRSELLVSDEVAIAGTISEITPVSRIDAFEFGTDGILAELLDDYMTAMRERWSLPNLRFEWMRNVLAGE